MSASVDLRLGDCLDVLRELPDESVHSIITDPPYGLADHKPEHIAYALIEWTWGNNREWVPDGKGFMGREWDAFVPPPAVWDECLRVLKPGGHLVAFAGSRTYDLMGMSIRLAGFEIRDGLQWLYGSGFPKGQDVGKAIDKAAGAEREVVGQKITGNAKQRTSRTGEFADGHHGGTQLVDVTAPATPEAARWEGWKTSLKPAVEPVVLARRPLSGTVAANVIAHGTGAINVAACRVNPGAIIPGGGGGDRSWKVNAPDGSGHAWMGGAAVPGTARESHTAGRWPANVLLTHAPECHEPGECAPYCPVADLDAQSGTTISQGGSRGASRQRSSMAGGVLGAQPDVKPGFGDEGGASRYFPTFRYQAKAPASERPKIDGKGWPTVKPQGLMRWLVRLLTPPGGVVLDPFAGTAATLQAARDEGFASIGVERDEFAYRLAQQRLADTVTPTAPDEPPSLLDLLDGEEAS